MLDCRDIAFAVAKLATMDATALPAGPMRMTGPQALTGPALCDRLSLATGREFTWVREKDAFLSHSKALASPLEVVGVYEAGADGYFETVHADAFAAAFGRHPTSFAKFANDYAAYFGAVR